MREQERARDRDRQIDRDSEKEIERERERLFVVTLFDLGLHCRGGDLGGRLFGALWGTGSWRPERQRPNEILTHCSQLKVCACVCLCLCVCLCGDLPKLANTLFKELIIYEEQMTDEIL